MTTPTRITHFGGDEVYPVKLVMPPDFTDWDAESINQRWQLAAIAELPTGARYSVLFVSTARVRQNLKINVDTGRPFVRAGNWVIVPDVQPDAVTLVAAEMYRAGNFTFWRPLIDLFDPNGEVWQVAGKYSIDSSDAGHTGDESGSKQPYVDAVGWCTDQVVSLTDMEPQDERKAAEVNLMTGVVTLTTGKRYKVTFVTLPWVNATMEANVNSGKPYIDLPGLIVLTQLTFELALAAAMDSAKYWFFTRLLPID